MNAQKNATHRQVYSIRKPWTIPSPKTWSGTSRAVFDGGYASKANLAAAKKLGVEHVVFQKKSGLKFADMTPSSWIYARLRRFRAGVQAGISYLKRKEKRASWQPLVVPTLP